jgi:hypothetical protein
MTALTPATVAAPTVSAFLAFESTSILSFTVFVVAGIFL